MIRPLSGATAKLIDRAAVPLCRASQAALARNGGGSLCLRWTRWSAVNETFGGDRGRDTLGDGPGHCHDALEPAARKAHLIARADALCRFGTVSVHTDVAAFARRCGRRPCFRQTDGPQPAVDADGVGRAHHRSLGDGSGDRVEHDLRREL